VRNATSILKTLTAAGVTGAAPAPADPVSYLVNVTVRPAYTSADADTALAHGYVICDAVAHRRSYAQVTSDVRADFQTTDQYQASYPVTQAVNELCPALIWQLRNSATHVGPPVP